MSIGHLNDKNAWISKILDGSENVYWPDGYHKDGWELKLLNVICIKIVIGR